MSMKGQDSAGGRPLLALINRDMAVVDSDGTRIGTVDKLVSTRSLETSTNTSPRIGSLPWMTGSH